MVTTSEECPTFQSYISRLNTEGVVKRPMRRFMPELREYPFMPDSAVLITPAPLYVVKRLKSGFIAQHIRGNPYSVEAISDNCFLVKAELSYRSYLVFYPYNLRHAEIFSRSKVTPLGFADYFPGSVAVLSFYCDGWNDHQASLTTVQYSFKQGSPVELTRGLTSRYMGVRKHLLEYLLLWAIQNGVPAVKLPIRPDSHSSERTNLRMEKYRQELTDIIVANNWKGLVSFKENALT